MNKISIIIICFFLLFAPCIYAQGLEKAEALYLQNSFSDSIAECLLYTKEEENADKAYYFLGLNYLRINDIKNAREYLKFFKDNFKSSKYIDAGLLAYGDTFFLEQEFSRAEGIYKDMLSINTNLAPTLMLRLAQCSLKQGNWQAAKDYIGKIREKYPFSLDAQQAETIDNEDSFFFTIQAGSFKNLANARLLEEELKNKGFQAYITEAKSTDGSVFYRVRVGKLSGFQETEKLKYELEEQGYPARVFP